LHRWLLFCKEKRTPRTAYCLVYLYPTRRKKGSRLWFSAFSCSISRVWKFCFLVSSSAVENSSTRDITLPVYQLESFRNVEKDNPPDLVVCISRFGAVPSGSLLTSIIWWRNGHGPPDCGTVCGVDGIGFWRIAKHRAEAGRVESSAALAKRPSSQGL
jgi:hypothetical protein